MTKEGKWLIENGYKPHIWDSNKEEWIETSSEPEYSTMGIMHCLWNNGEKRIITGLGEARRGPTVVWPIPWFMIEDTGYVETSKSMTDKYIDKYGMENFIANLKGDLPLKITKDEFN